jgi:hypothetical protein
MMDDVCNISCSQTFQDFSSHPNAKRAKNTINQFTKILDALEVDVLCIRKSCAASELFVKTVGEILRLMKDDIKDGTYVSQ